MPTCCDILYIRCSIWYSTNQQTHFYRTAITRPWKPISLLQYAMRGLPKRWNENIWLVTTEITAGKKTLSLFKKKLAKEMIAKIFIQIQLQGSLTYWPVRSVFKWCSNVVQQEKKCVSYAVRKNWYCIRWKSAANIYLKRKKLGIEN